MTEASVMSDSITELLHSHHAGDRQAFDRLMPLVYQQLSTVARRQLRRLSGGSTLDTSALVQETYLELIGETGVDWQDRGHFLAICARTMRRILIDAARRRYSSKRNGQIATEVDLDSLSSNQHFELLLAVDQALDQLARLDPHLIDVVECRFFAGMSEAETALALDLSLRTVQRDWLRARVWLQQALS
jgi:RNA polymerase sigma-70 factor, ECF subfamily